MKAILSVTVLLLAQAALADTPQPATATHAIAAPIVSGATAQAVQNSATPDCIKANADLAAAQAELAKASSDKAQAQADLIASGKETSNPNKMLKDEDNAQAEISAAKAADHKANADFQGARKEAQAGHC